VTERLEASIELTVPLNAKVLGLWACARAATNVKKIPINSFVRMGFPFLQFVVNG
jgi:hypothetical protein